MLILIEFLFLCFHSNHLGGSDDLEKKSIVNIDNFFKKHDLISRKSFEIHIQKLQITNYIVVSPGVRFLCLL